MPKMITIVGRAVDCIETAKPWIILVACPDWDEFATDLTGENSVLVYYSVIHTIRPVTVSPTNEQ